MTPPTPYRDRNLSSSPRSDQTGPAPDRERWGLSALVKAGTSDYVGLDQVCEAQRPGNYRMQPLQVAPSVQRPLAQIDRRRPALSAGAPAGLADARFRLRADIHQDAP